jgi:DNA helicase-2/ATP-dependent DNA helicase PcrA
MKKRADVKPNKEEIANSAAIAEADTAPAPWDKNMNPEQLKAIYHVDGPCAVLAQAGSGKTRALVHRIARMVRGLRIDPARIMAVTFSKKAADEMNVRLEQLEVTEARIGTWHSLCLQILKDDHTTWGSWAIDEKDRHKWIVKDVLGYKKKGREELSLDWKQADLAKVRRFITMCKANLWTWEHSEALELAREEFGTMRDFSGRPQFQLALDAFRLSQRVIEEECILTFDDFLVFAHRHLCDEENRQRWAGKWDYVLQDEAQDANRAQCEIARLLSQDHRNYMVVGDTAQSIYGFRGSTPAYLANFAKDWEGAEVVIMNRNYRSGDAIVQAANDIIRPAEVRLPTDMLAERGIEGSVRVVHATDFDNEAAEFAGWAEEHWKATGKLSDVTCLFRLNAQSRALEEELLKRRIPYVIVGGTSFYDRKEVKDLLSYLRVAIQRDKEGDAVKRCINAPFRFLGQAFVERVMKASSPDCDWSEVVREVAQQERLMNKQRESAVEWAALIEEVRTMMESDKLTESRPTVILDFLVRRTNYIAWIEKEEGGESIETSGGANVRELIRVAERFDTVDEMLTYIEKNQAAAKRQRKDKQAGGERLLLMSIHRSKGLEWPNVWVVGCNEMILPHVKGDVEEERRLMYVAATRARDNLVLSHVREMATRSGIKQGTPSKFLVDANLV